MANVDAGAIIDLSNISNGLYIVSVKVGNERHEQKLVISKN